MKKRRWTLGWIGATAGLVALAATASASQASVAGPKQSFCTDLGCPDETFEHCFSGEVTLDLGPIEITGSVTCYEPDRGGPPGV